MLARELRRRSTPAEDALWQALRGKQLDGFKFLRQHPIIYGRTFHGHLLFFIADFYCAKLRLVIELDGSVHNFQKEYDQNRDLILSELGMRVLRIKNEEMEDVEKVLGRIRKVTHP